MRRLIAAAALAAGVAAALCGQQGRVSWSAYYQMQGVLNFEEWDVGDAEHEDTPGVQPDNYEMEAALQMWYGNGKVSMWSILTFQGGDFYPLWDWADPPRSGSGWSGKVNLSYDNDKTGAYGGKVQVTTGKDDDLAKVKGADLYGWLQFLNKRVLVQFSPDLCVDGNEYTAGIKGVDSNQDWDAAWTFMIYGADNWDSPFKIPGNELLFEDDSNYADNQRTFILTTFKGFVRNLEFGFGLPHLGYMGTDWVWHQNVRARPGENNKYWDAEDWFLNANVGAKYKAGPLTIVGGGKLDPTYYTGLYLGGEYKLLGGRMNVQGAARAINVTGWGEDLGEFRFAEVVEFFPSSRLSLNLTVKEKYLGRTSWTANAQPDGAFWDWDEKYRDRFGVDHHLYGEGTRTQIDATAYARYALMNKKVLTELAFGLSKGLGELNDHYFKFTVAPALYWSLGSGEAGADLPSQGLFAKYDFGYGTTPSDDDIRVNKITFGFKWAN